MPQKSYVRHGLHETIYFPCSGSCDHIHVESRQATLGSSEVDSEGMIEKCLTFKREKLKMEGYIDSDFAGEVDHMRSSTGYVFTIWSIIISWVS